MLCLIGISKAIDTISDSKALTKLPSYGINGKNLKWFENYSIGQHK